MRLYLTRHGETDWNKIRRTQGRTDLPLNEKGRQQAQRLANRMKDKGICCVYTSPMSRAADTARAISEACGAKLVIDERLTERDFGPLEGVTFPELLKKYPKEMDVWMNDPYNHVQPGVEPIPQIIERIVSFLDDVKKNHTKNEDIMVVSHGTVAGLLLMYLMDIPMKKLHHMGMSNCCYTQIMLGDGLLPYNFLVTLNDISHLEGLQ